jgi:hypothetical protein
VGAELTCFFCTVQGAQSIWALSLFLKIENSPRVVEVLGRGFACLFYMLGMLALSALYLT